MSLKLSLISSVALLAASSAFAAPMIGFSTAGAEAERATEAKFDAVLSADAMRDRLKLMSSEPNQVGSPHDKANAEYTLAQYKAWGWDAHIETFSVLYPTPKEEKLELGGAHPFAATLTEPAIEGDVTSAHQQGGLPAYFAYGGEGDVTAPLIYVNYGMPADYAALQRLGLDVRGKIVIARYGAGWRGLKPKLAQEHGAVGCIVFSDPADDGYGTNDAYPKGPSRPERGLQRGSVQDLPVEPGDPLTPGYGAVEGAPRIARADAKTILKIPAVPISWGDAQVFLRALGGPVAPKGWRGALPITYHPLRRPDAGGVRVLGGAGLWHGLPAQLAGTALRCRAGQHRRRSGERQPRPGAVAGRWLHPSTRRRARPALRPAGAVPRRTLVNPRRGGHRAAPAGARGAVAGRCSGLRLGALIHPLRRRADGDRPTPARRTSGTGVCG